MVKLEQNSCMKKFGITMKLTCFFHCFSPSPLINFNTIKKGKKKKKLMEVLRDPAQQVSLE